MAPISEEKPDKKRFKFNNNEAVNEEVNLKLTKTISERCGICKQYENEILYYHGHPNNSVEEYITLTNDSLMLFTGDEASLDENDERPTHKVYL